MYGIYYVKRVCIQEAKNILNTNLTQIGVALLINWPNILNISSAQTYVFAVKLKEFYSFLFLLLLPNTDIWIPEYFKNFDSALLHYASVVHAWEWKNVWEWKKKNALQIFELVYRMNKTHGSSFHYQKVIFKYIKMSVMYTLVVRKKSIVFNL